jgi:N-acetylglutamate synthase-like GNAT family acetyltransferase
MVIRRRRAEGELVVEQTHGLSRVAAVLAAAGMSGEGLARPAACHLIAYLGNEPVGVVSVESAVDAALMRSLAVVEPMRRQGVGAALIAAARVAAHSRGALRLYTFACGAGAYLGRFGFSPVPAAELHAALRSLGTIDLRFAQPPELTGARVLCLDISRDGLIAR